MTKDQAMNRLALTITVSNGKVAVDTNNGQKMILNRNDEQREKRMEKPVCADVAISTAENVFTFFGYGLHEYTIAHTDHDQEKDRHIFTAIVLDYKEDTESFEE